MRVINDANRSKIFGRDIGGLHNSKRIINIKNNVKVENYLDISIGISRDAVNLDRRTARWPRGAP
jgi:hypothetical protein